MAVRCHGPTLRGTAMHVIVRFFASYREIAGSREMRLELKDGATLRTLLDSIYAKHPSLRTLEETTLLAVNQEFASPTVTIHDGDEIALMPPVSGGAPMIAIQRK
ncbi:MAG: molybdopterin converting factor subunit 1, partial [Candidatus Thermoplasmatota archaeon]